MKHSGRPGPSLPPLSRRERGSKRFPLPSGEGGAQRRVRVGFLRNAALCALAMLALAGCERGMHEMYDQPKYKPLTASPLWADGNLSLIHI